MSPAAASPRQNRLLAMLPDNEYSALAPALERAPLALGQSLHEPGSPQRHAFFPVNCLVSLISVLENGASTEIGVTGCEGMVGVAIFTGGGSTTSRAVVQGQGLAWRLPAAPLLAQFERGGTLRGVLLRYSQALITQITQTAVCNRHHSVDQQLCRWLLLSLDRLPGRELSMTQQRIADMLGVRREGVTQAAHKLQEAGVVTYRRGHIVVRDRAALEKSVCECYGVVRREYDRLLTQK